MLVPPGERGLSGTPLATPRARRPGATRRRRTAFARSGRTPPALPHGRARRTTSAAGRFETTGRAKTGRARTAAPPRARRAPRCRVPRRPSASAPGAGEQAGPPSAGRVRSANPIPRPPAIPTAATLARRRRFWVGRTTGSRARPLRRTRAVATAPRTRPPVEFRGRCGPVARGDRTRPTAARTRPVASAPRGRPADPPRPSRSAQAAGDPCQLKRRTPFVGRGRNRRRPSRHRPSPTFRRRSWPAPPSAGRTSGEPRPAAPAASRREVAGPRRLDFPEVLTTRPSRGFRAAPAGRPARRRCQWSWLPARRPQQPLSPGCPCDAGDSGFRPGTSGLRWSRWDSRRGTR